MSAMLPGVAGSLLPSRFLSEGQWAGLAPDVDAAFARRGRHLDRWWRRAEARCGPATGIRAIVDDVAVPLTGILGFRLRAMSFEGVRAFVDLEARTGSRGTPVAMLVLPWASRPSTAWRDVTRLGQRLGASWGLVLAPPYLSVVDLGGLAVRRSIDFELPLAFGSASARVFWAVAGASNFVWSPGAGMKVARIDRLVTQSATFADGVRRDLQVGVLTALDELMPVVGGDDRRRFDEALVVIFRVLFLLFAESRDLVPRRHPTYRRSYTIGALCRQALDAHRGSDERRLAGLWDGLAAMTRLSRAGCDTGDLIVRPFNGKLFARQAAPSLEPATGAARPTRVSARQDRALATVLLSLATRTSASGRETIDYADLGVEQLGGVYERLLDADRGSATKPERKPPVRSGHSAARKASGSFYTPRALCDFLVRRTLTPLVSGRSSDEILTLRVVDPAMGSGAFLVSACRFLARAYEEALIEEGRRPPTMADDRARADMRRLVAERCLFGVDANPTAVQLARLSLWLATLAQGKPLTFLDHRLRPGNSLIGTTPDLLRLVSDHRRRAGRLTTLPLFDLATLDAPMRDVVRPLTALASRRDDTVNDVRAKEAAWAALRGDRSPLAAWRLAHDLWCARWFSPAPGTAGETRAALASVLDGDRTLPRAVLDRRLADTSRMAAAHGFFHWPLEFPDVFYDAGGAPRGTPGFDAVIGNPPWEMLRRDGEAAEPRRLVDFIRHSGLYPSSDRGHMNVYQPFVERALDLARPGGRVGLVLPWGLAVDDGAESLRARIFDASRLDVIVGLDNGAGLFPIHRGLRFLALVTTAGGRSVDGRGRFGVRTAEELARLPGGDAEPGTTPWPVRLDTRGGTGVGGRSRRIPDARRPGDLEVAERLRRAFPRLGDPAGWGARFSRELNASDDKHAFGPIGLPVVEGKHVTPFGVATRATSHRIARASALRLLPDGRFERPRLVYRDVSGVANRRSLIAAIAPAGVVTTHTVFCLRTPMAIERQHYLCACFNSYVLNAVVRLLMGGHVTTSLVEDLPLPAWRGSALERRIARVGRRLAQASRALGTAAVGGELTPRMAQLEAALQAGVARRLGLDAAAFETLVEGFPLVPEIQRRRAVEAVRTFRALGARRNP